MKRVLVIMAVLAAATPLLAAPFYSTSWNFEGDALGGPAAGWTNYVPSWSTPSPATSTMGVHNASLYAPLSGIPVFDSKWFGASMDSGAIASKTTLAAGQQTNRFTLEWREMCDIKRGSTGYLSASGVKIQTMWNNVANAGEIWYESEGNNSKNLRVGTANVLASSGRVVVKNTATNLFAYDNILAQGLTAGGSNTIPANGGIISLKMEYNLNEDGKIRFFAKTNNYTSADDPAVGWRTGYKQSDGWFPMALAGANDYIQLNIDPATGTYPVLTTINLQISGWTHTHFDDIALTSVPEPATLGLLLLGLPLLRRRR